MTVIGRAQKERRRVDRATGDDVPTGADLHDFTVFFDLNCLNAAPAGVGQQTADISPRPQCDIRIVLYGRADTAHVGIALGSNFAGKPVARFAADTAPNLAQ